MGGMHTVSSAHPPAVAAAAAATAAFAASSRSAAAAAAAAPLCMVYGQHSHQRVDCLELPVMSPVQRQHLLLR